MSTLQHLRSLLSLLLPGRWIVSCETWTRSQGNWHPAQAEVLARFRTYRAARRGRITWQERIPSTPAALRYYTITRI